MWASWFALKGVPDQVGCFLGASGSLGEGHVVVCRLATSPSDPSLGSCYLEFIYLLLLKLCSLQWSPAFCSLCGGSHFWGTHACSKVKLGRLEQRPGAARYAEAWLPPLCANPKPPTCSLCNCTHLGSDYLHIRS